MCIKEIILNHYKKYPKMEAEDFLKLIHQHSFGCGHFISNTTNNYDFLKKEWILCDKSYDTDVFNYIGNGYTRFNLYNGKNNGFNIDLIHKIFIASANLLIEPINNKDVEVKLGTLLQLCKSNTINLNYQNLQHSIRDYQNTNYAPIRHSKTYHTFYYPSYRVLNIQYLKYLDLLISLEHHLKSSNSIIIAIDGRAGSGKTLLGNFLKTIYDCNLIHMDDFFIPISLRDNLNWEENIHLPRFMEEVYNGLKSKTNFSYGVFNCKEQKITKKINMSPKKLTIIEGSYSISPHYDDLYTIKAFVDIEPSKQLERIEKRDGNKIAEIFEKKWIPAENFYFEKHNTKEKAHIIID